MAKGRVKETGAPAQMKLIAAFPLKHPDIATAGTKTPPRAPAASQIYYACSWSVGTAGTTLDLSYTQFHDVRHSYDE